MAVWYSERFIIGNRFFRGTECQDKQQHICPSQVPPDFGYSTSNTELLLMEMLLI